MKKIGFTVQVLTLIIALPLLSILELNHVTVKDTGKKTDSYVNATAEDEPFAFKIKASGKI